MMIFKQLKRLKLPVFFISLIYIPMFFLLNPNISFAIDGQIDILPDGKSTLTISKRGSYVLVDNVQMINDVLCIDITCDNVTLNLNGHSITGLGAGKSSTAGIKGKNQTKIFNGRVGSFFNAAIELEDECNLEDIYAINNKVNGINVKNKCHLKKVTASSNQNYGISAENNCLIEECIASNNNQNGGCSGINALQSNVIKNCIAVNNSPASGHTRGISVTDFNTLLYNICSNNTTTEGAAYGIKAANDCEVKFNTCFGNTTESGSSNPSFGIDILNRCKVANNVCYNNVAKGQSMAYGINADDYCLIENNVCKGNSGGVAGFGIYSGSFCTIVNNSACRNYGYLDSSTGFGISVQGNNGIIRNNVCYDNDGKGAGMLSVGIYIYGKGNIIEKNHCSYQSGGDQNYGILIDFTSTDNSIVKNTTTFNSTAGIKLSGGGNYYGENIGADTTPISDSATNTAGSGNRSNISY